MTFTINHNSFTIPHHTNINFSYFKGSIFLKNIYTNCYNLLQNNNHLYQLDFDNQNIKNIIQNAINLENPQNLINKLNGETISNQVWNRDPLNKAMLLFLVSSLTSIFYLKI